MSRASGTVDAFMRDLDHPFKAEVEAIRTIIKGVHPAITEEVKWNAPSFAYKGHMATFNLWAQGRVYLVFHEGALLEPAPAIFEGTYPDRRMVYFTSMDDLLTKKDQLIRAVLAWIRLRDASGSGG